MKWPWNGVWPKYGVLRSDYLVDRLPTSSSSSSVRVIRLITNVVTCAGSTFGCISPRVSTPDTIQDAQINLRIPSVCPGDVHDRSPPNLHWRTPLPSFTSYNQPSNRAPPGLAPGYLDTSRGLLLKGVVSRVSPNRLGHVIRDLTRLTD